MADVVFRRIGGRIVPIRLNKPNKKERRDMAKGAGALAGGAAAVIGSDYLGAQATNAVAKSAKKFFDQAQHFGRVGKAQQALLGNKKIRKEGVKAGWDAVQKLTKRLDQSVEIGNQVRKHGKTFGLALAGVGVGKLINPFTKGKDQGVIEETASNLAGFGIVFGGNHLYKKVLKNKMSGWTFRTASPAAKNAKAVTQMVFKGVL